MTEIQEKIRQLVSNVDVVLFMKGDKDMPACGYSSLANQVLNLLGVEFEAINVLASEDIRQGIKDYTNWPTIPQLYVKGEFIGGADIIREMYESGELSDLLKEKNISLNPQTMD